MTHEDEEFTAPLFETPNVVNPDNQSLHPIGSIGHVDEVNGPGAIGMPDFIATRHELLQLAKYWFTVAIDYEFFMFLYQQTGSDWLRKMHFGYRRVNRIAACLGDAAVEQACKEAEGTFVKTVDANAWRIFCEGTAEEIAALHKKVNEDVWGTEGEGSG